MQNWLTPKIVFHIAGFIKNIKIKLFGSINTLKQKQNKINQ